MEPDRCLQRHDRVPGNRDRFMGLELGRAGEGNIEGPVLASFDSSQVTGEAPYLIEVVIGPDLTATIEQRSALPRDPTSGSC
jgi:hypothetical protein